MGCEELLDRDEIARCRGQEAAEQRQKYMDEHPEKKLEELELTLRNRRETDEKYQKELENIDTEEKKNTYIENKRKEHEEDQKNKEPERNKKILKRLKDYFIYVMGKLHLNDKLEKETDIYVFDKIYDEYLKDWESRRKTLDKLSEYIYEKYTFPTWHRNTASGEVLKKDIEDYVDSHIKEGEDKSEHQKNQDIINAIKEKHGNVDTNSIGLHGVDFIINKEYIKVFDEENEREKLVSREKRNKVWIEKSKEFIPKIEKEIADIKEKIAAAPKEEQKAPPQEGGKKGRKTRKKSNRKTKKSGKKSGKKSRKPRRK